MTALAALLGIVVGLFVFSFSTTANVFQRSRHWRVWANAGTWTFAIALSGVALAFIIAVYLANPF